MELELQVRTNFSKVVYALDDAGVELIPISMPSTRYALSAYYVISSAEASSNLARYNGGDYGKAAISVTVIFSSYGHSC